MGAAEMFALWCFTDTVATRGLRQILGPGGGLVRSGQGTLEDGRGALLDVLGCWPRGHPAVGPLQLVIWEGPGNKQMSDGS